VRLDRARGFVNIRFWGAFMAVGGSITLTNGVAGLRPRKGRTVVASVCGAMEALTRALAVELASHLSLISHPEEITHLILEAAGQQA
jgi:NAD(P)-dependent dehydrogenase (short-subunit alcohol dehydrogenase family)